MRLPSIFQPVTMAMIDLPDENIISDVNRRQGCSHWENTLSTSQLMQFHRPKSKEELIDLILKHHPYYGKCRTCKQIGKDGSLTEWAMHLYHEQFNMYPEERYTFSQAWLWMYNLFIERTWLGREMELRAIQEMNDMLPSAYHLWDALPQEDRDFAVDSWVYYGDPGATRKDEMKRICGLQVKPKSYFEAERLKSAREKEAQKHDKVPEPVHFLIYDKNQSWTNFYEIEHLILHIPVTLGENHAPSLNLKL